MGKYWEELKTEDERQFANYLFVAFDEEEFEEYFERLLQSNYFHKRNCAVFRATLEKYDEARSRGRYKEEQIEVLRASIPWQEKEKPKEWSIDLMNWEVSRAEYVARTMVGGFEKKEKAKLLHDLIDKNEMWDVIEQLLKPRKVLGRPVGHRNVGDRNQLRRMKVLLSSKKAKTVRQAALRVAKIDAAKSNVELESRAKHFERLFWRRKRLRDQGMELGAQVG